MEKIAIALFLVGIPLMGFAFLTTLVIPALQSAFQVGP